MAQRSHPKPKFDDCRTCIYFLRTRVNPICKQCDAGEFYEERQVSREKTLDELMKMYEEYADDE